MRSALTLLSSVVPPFFENNVFLATQTAIINQEDASVKCEAAGDQPLHIGWKRNGLDIDPDHLQFTVSCCHFLTRVFWIPAKFPAWDSGVGGHFAFLWVHFCSFDKVSSTS